MKQKLLIIALVIIFCIPILLPLLHPGFFLTDDGEWMIIRFSAFYQALRDGQFPVRWLGRLNFEFGYPVANFLYPGFMYLGIPLHILGFGFVTTIKIILGLSIIFSFLFFYLWLSKFFNKLSAFVGAFVYVYLPYHLFDLFKRGSVGELLAMAIAPFIFWNVERRNIFWTSIGVGLLILSHNTLALLFLLLLCLYMLLDVIVSQQKKQLLSQHMSALLFGIGMSFFFWFPAVYDLRYVVFSNISVSNWSEYFVNLDLVGIPTVVILLIVCVLFITGKVTVVKHRLTLLVFIIGCTSLFLSTSASKFLWEIVPISFIQFPFRFLSIVIFCASFLVAFIMSQAPKHFQKIFGIIIIFSAFFSSISFMNPQSQFDKGDSYYATNVDTTTVKNEYMPVWVKRIPNEIPKDKITSRNAKISDIVVKTNYARFTSESSSSSQAEFHTVFFPGWTAKIDGNDATILFDNESGIMNVSVPSGKHTILFAFQETTARIMSDILSLLSIGMLILYLLRDKILKNITS